MHPGVVEVPTARWVLLAIHFLFHIFSKQSFPSAPAVIF